MQRYAICLFAVGLLAATPVFAAGLRNWDGRKVDHTCRAAPGDLAGLMATLRRHEAARVGFKYKMQHGFYRVQAHLKKPYADASANETVAEIAKNLKQLSGRPGRYRSYPTAALIYDIGRQSDEVYVCAWLLSAAGIEAATTTRLLTGRVAELVRVSLDVTTRAARLAPRPRKRRDRRKRATHPEALEPSSEALHWVGSELLSPAISERLLAKRFRRLLILPAADLSTVPFAGLPLGGKALIDYVAPVILPDLDALIGGWYPRQPILNRPLVIGDPDLSGDRRWKFQPLPGARAEAETAADLLGTRAIVAKAASRKAVLAKLRRRRDWSFIYFATHGIADPVNPMDGSFLALRRGHLFARDIKKLKFEYRPTVVMSACQTGLGKVFEGGVFGLARAWHKAGAAQVVMSLWNIDDKATRRLMYTFMLGMKAGVPAEFALQKAMQAHKRSLVDPALWSGFSVFGLPHDPKTVLR